MGMVGRAQGGGGAATMAHNGTCPLLVPWMCQDCQDGSTSKWLSGSDPTIQELEGMEEMPLNAKVEFLPHRAHQREAALRLWW